jgi:hypothetical protein
MENLPFFLPNLTTYENMVSLCKVLKEIIMAIILEGGSDAGFEYLLRAAKNKYPLTHRGDSPLSPAFDEALIRAAAGVDDTHDPRQDAEAIAQYILEHAPCPLTCDYQDAVRKKLEDSQLTDSELAAKNITRAEATASLLNANAEYTERQKLEFRAAIARNSIFP